MSNESDDLIILKHTWSLATESIRSEFREILLGHVSTPPTVDAPYAAPIRIWQRMNAHDQSEFLGWTERKLREKVR
jgi:hypothetical protein